MQKLLVVLLMSVAAILSFAQNNVETELVQELQEVTQKYEEMKAVHPDNPALDHLLNARIDLHTLVDVFGFNISPFGYNPQIYTLPQLYDWSDVHLVETGVLALLILNGTDYANLPPGVDVYVDAVLASYVQEIARFKVKVLL